MKNACYNKYIIKNYIYCKIMFDKNKTLNTYVRVRKTRRKQNQVTYIQSGLPKPLE